MATLLLILCAMSEAFLLWFLTALVREKLRPGVGRVSGRARTRRHSLVMRVEPLERMGSGKKPPGSVAVHLG